MVEAGAALLVLLVPTALSVYKPKGINPIWLAQAAGAACAVAAVAAAIPLDLDRAKRTGLRA